MNGMRWLRVSEVEDSFRKRGKGITLYRGLQLKLQNCHESEPKIREKKKITRGFLVSESFSCWNTALLATRCLLLLPAQ